MTTFTFARIIGELDAMSVYEATGIAAVSLPNGARSLPVELLPMLERFKKIYLWMDDDGPSCVLLFFFFFEEEC